MVVPNLRLSGMALALMILAGSPTPAQDGAADFPESAFFIQVIRQVATQDSESSRLAIISMIRDEFGRNTGSFRDNRDELVAILESLAGEGLFTGPGRRLPEKPFHAEVHAQAVALLGVIGGGDTADFLARLAREFPVLPAARLIDDFEKPSGWTASCPADAAGIRIASALRPGAPIDLAANPRGETAVRNPQRNVLGVKAEFLDVRDYALLISPARPLPVPSIRSLDAWVYGNNTDHVLWLRLGDAAGKPVGEAFWGRLDFMGWKKMTLVIPQELAGIPLAITGFVIRCDPLSLRKGTLYFYFDALTVTALEARP
ncbi:MAG: hypothetical protein NT080_09375 [Spirochaetes bacterium]|nr:hypothetical protein [Spirochaetota bacterium]